MKINEANAIRLAIRAGLTRADINQAPEDAIHDMLMFLFADGAKEESLPPGASMRFGDTPPTPGVSLINEPHPDPCSRTGVFSHDGMNAIFDDGAVADAEAILDKEEDAARRRNETADERWVVDYGRSCRELIVPDNHVFGGHAGEVLINEAELLVDTESKRSMDELTVYSDESVMDLRASAFGFETRRKSRDHFGLNSPNEAALEVAYFGCVGMWTRDRDPATRDSSLDSVGVIAFGSYNEYVICTFNHANSWEVPEFELPSNVDRFKDLVGMKFMPTRLGHWHSMPRDWCMNVEAVRSIDYSELNSLAKESLKTAWRGGPLVAVRMVHSRHSNYGHEWACDVATKGTVWGTNKGRKFGVVDRSGDIVTLKDMNRGEVFTTSMRWFCTPINKLNESMYSNGADLPSEQAAL